MDYNSTNYQDMIPVQRIRKSKPAQLYYHEEPIKYANITNERSFQRRTQNEEPHNDRYSGHEKRQIPGKQTNSDLVNDLTDRFMEVNYIPRQPVRSADETTVIYSAPKSRFQSVGNNSRSTRPPARDNFESQNCPFQNLEERSPRRGFQTTTKTPGPGFQVLADHSLAYSEMRRSEATKQMIAGDTVNRNASNDLSVYQPRTSSKFNQKLCELENHSHPRISKEKINVYCNKGNGEPKTTVLNMEEMASDFVDSNVFELDQKKQFPKVVNDALQLEKTKSLVVGLIDNALEKLKSKRLERKVSETSFTGSNSQMKQMKNSCFKIIDDELNLLKTLENFSTETE